MIDRQQPPDDEYLRNHSLADARQRAVNLRQSLPEAVSVAALGVKSRTPFHILCAREAMAWRTEELSRTACDAIEKGDIAAGILLTRAVMESTAYIWRLRKLLTTRAQKKPDEFHDAAWAMFAGWKNVPVFPQSVNIQTLIEDIDKTICGFQKGYALLSEVAHPNYSGVAAIFSEFDKPNFVMKFPGNQRGIDMKSQTAIEMLATSLDLFMFAYNKISDEMPGYLVELEPIAQT